METAVGGLRVECTAVFPLVDRAKTFEAKITEPGWWAIEVKRRGRTVTWVGAIPAGASTTEIEYLMDMRETVGFHGSDQRRRATLNGVPCRMVW